MFKASRTILRKITKLSNIPKRTQSGGSTTDIFINGKPVTVPSYYTIAQALRGENVPVPTFCYHERLSIAGNCRMCLVEIEGVPKPQIACAMPVGKNMKIRTNSEMTYKAQESVLEFLLINHPLDCPICDQGGECDLQDLNMRFGNDRNRFTDIHFEGKRAVEDKYLGPLIRAEMNRCIHCTRCIRFASQVCGLDVLGTTGRGTDMHVGTYVDKMFLSELSGNIIDLCPVGALTSIPYKFKARPWEVIRTNSIDVTDATGTNIVVNHRFNRVLRVLPRENDEVNQEWLSDKGRWAIDSLEMQRLTKPMIRGACGLEAVEWDYALATAGSMIKILTTCSPHKLMAIAGPYCNAETLVVAKDLLNALGSDHTYTERGCYYTKSGIDLRAAYSLNVNMKDIVTADKILLVGTNPRFEAPILNAWIRQAYRENECDIYYVGPPADFNYHVTDLGPDIKVLENVSTYLTGKKPLIFVGVAQLEGTVGGKIITMLSKYTSQLKMPMDWGVLNVIPREASFCGALEVGWQPGSLAALEKDKPEILICLGADEIFYNWVPPPKCTVIYIGFQGDKGAECAQILLPGSAYTESGGVYLNMECRSQRAMSAVSPPGNARSDWKILRALAEYCGVCPFYCNQESLHCRMAQISPNLVFYGDFQPKLFKELIDPFIYSSKDGSNMVDIDMKTLEQYYCADVFTYNSPTMIKARNAAIDFKIAHYNKI